MRFSAYSNGHSWEAEWDSPEDSAKAFAEDRVSRGKDYTPVEVEVTCVVSKRAWRYVVDVHPREGYDCSIASCEAVEAA